MPEASDSLHETEEVTMQTQPTRNPIAKSFGAGINRPQVLRDKRRDRRVKHRNRDIERDED